MKDGELDDQCPNMTRTSSFLTPTESVLLAELEAFERSWVRVSKLLLLRRAPQVGAAFSEYFDDDEANIPLIVARFLGGLEALEDASAPFFADGPPARALLRMRGLSDEKVAFALGLLARLRYSWKQAG